MGTIKDTQRRLKLWQDTQERRVFIDKMRARIFNQGISVNNRVIKNLLDAEGSLVPVRNAFSSIPDVDFDFYSLFVPDLLHEFEIGVWKSIFTHLMRILVAQGGSAVTDLNRRYRAISTFGTGPTIRKFSANASAMTKLAARDFEDLLQCALPVFEGLLPEPHNTIVLDLLFTLGSWHAYAKLRMHTKMTLKLFDEATIALGRQVRRFKRTTCTAYITKELPKETAARGRRKAAMVNKGKGLSAASSKNGSTNEPKIKTLNINTYKFHSLSKYPGAIRYFGTSDSYSTQIVRQQLSNQFSFARC